MALNECLPFFLNAAFSSNYSARPTRQNVHQIHKYLYIYNIPQIYLEKLWSKLWLMIDSNHGYEWIASNSDRQLHSGANFCPFSAVMLWYYAQYPSNHLPLFILSWVTEVAVSSESRKRPFPWPHQAALIRGFQGVPRPTWRYNPYDWSWVYPLVSYKGPEPPQLAPF